MFRIFFLCLRWFLVELPQKPPPPWKCLFVRWWRGNIRYTDLSLRRWGELYAQTDLWPKILDFIDFKRFLGESFRFQSLADFKGVQHRDVVKKTRESNESLAVKLLTQSKEIGFAGWLQLRDGREELGPP